ncbi:MAG: hypothetical protein ABSC01_11720 [Verrucomicrobiota bacterium]|jgi:hypothetical protein
MAGFFDIEPQTSNRKPGFNLSREPSKRRSPTRRIAPLALFRSTLLGAGRMAVHPTNLARMSNSVSQTAICPSCGGEIESAKRRCPHCGRPMGERGFFFYAFWVGLSLIVMALIASIFYTGFLILNRML